MDLKQILFMVKLSAFDIHLLCNYKGIREMVFPLKNMKKEKKKGLSIVESQSLLRRMH